MRINENIYFYSHVFSAALQRLPSAHCTMPKDGGCDPLIQSGDNACGGVEHIMYVYVHLQLCL